MPHSAKKTSAKKADTTALPSRTKVGSVSKSSNKAKPHGTVKSSQSNRMKSTLSDSDGDREGSPVKRAKREIAPAPSVETSSSAGSSSSTVLPNNTSSLVYPNIDSTPAVSTEQDSSVKRAKNQADSTVASQRGVTVITSIGEKEIAPPAISPPDSPLPSLPDGNSNPNETSAQKKLRKLRWNRMLEAELPFLVAEAQTKLAMHKILQGAREMEKILIKAMEEDDSKPLTQEERDAREIASMQKLREANERFDRQFRMELESVLVDSHGLC